jgi:fatty acid desaturase
MTISGKLIKLFWQAVYFLCVILLFAWLAAVACYNVWTWIAGWLTIGWIMRREIGERIGPAIIWIINLLIVLLGGWTLTRLHGHWLWSRTEKFPAGTVFEYKCPLAIAAREQESIWLREKFRKKS